MVPTGLQHDDDKYDEYVVIDGALEKVGDWEVNLSNYYTKAETDQKIADAVKAATGDTSAASVLAALNAYKTSNDTRVKTVEDEVAALKAIQAEKNVINSVSDEFSISDTRKLSVNAISVAKITGLQDTLDSQNTRIGSLETIINSLDTTYVKIMDFNAVVGDLEQMKADNRNILTDIGELQNSLTWKEIKE